MASIFSRRKYQCKDCIYAYKPLKGEPSQGIQPGTAFEDLPSKWLWPTCKSTKKRFKPL